MNKKRTNEFTSCADCGHPETHWASINHGVLLCHQCAIVHRSLGRFISHLKPLKAKDWRASQLQMVLELYQNGSNSIWEHTLLDPHLTKSAPHSTPRKKPEAHDPINPTKSDFIRAKYQSFAYVNKSDASKDKQEFETDISEQLHSSVRTPNLKTSLRLLAAGANPNYMHTEKYNTPLHMAAKSGQLLQIELLLTYGANITLVDAKSKTAIDYARESGHYDIVCRLVEQQFDLTDTLTRYICGGKQPDHQSGEHFLIIDIRPECLHAADCEPSKSEESIRNMNAFRTESRQSIQSLNNKSFQELVKDIYDEIDRREVNQYVADCLSKDNNTTVANSLALPFLPVYHLFNSTRNQGRQKLALLNTKEFTLLIVDILSEIRRRIYGMDQMSGLKDVTNYNQEFDDIDSEPLYDSVPSEADYDECNERLSYHPAGQAINKEELDKKYVSVSEYSMVKEQMLKSAKLMEQFFNENREMRNEIGRLQSTVDKISSENAQLQQMILTVRSSLGSLSTTDFGKTHSAVYDSSLEQLNRNSYQRHSGRVRPQSSNSQSYSSAALSSAHAAPHHNRYSNEGIMGKPPPSSSSSNSITSPSSKFSLGQPPGSNQQLHHLPSSQQAPALASAGMLHSPNSSNNSLSSLPHIAPNLQTNYNPYQIYYDMNSGSQPNSSHFTLNSGPSSLTKSSSMPAASPSLPAAAHGPILPSKDEVIKKIEQITNSIKELLSNAREAKHDEFTSCSERICNHADDMIALFPENTLNENQLVVSQSLAQLRDNAMKLHEECNSYELASLTGLYSKQQKSDNKIIYNSVIDKAAEVASSVKQIVGFYSV